MLHHCGYLSFDTYQSLKAITYQQWNCRPRHGGDKTPRDTELLDLSMGHVDVVNCTLRMYFSVCILYFNSALKKNIQERDKEVCIKVRVERSSLISEISAIKSTGLDN